MKKIDAYLNRYKSKNFNELLFSFIDLGNHKDSEIYKLAGIDRKLFSKIRCNKNYIPSRNVVIKLGLALKLNRYDFNKLLNSAGYSLRSNNNFDLVVSYCLDNHIYDTDTINDYLFTYANAVL